MNTQAVIYAGKVADRLNEKFLPTTFFGGFHLDTRGQKFIRVYEADEQGKPRTVALFVDAEGNVYKAAGWKAPAKGVRFNVATAEGLDAMIDKADRYGSYLYR